LAAWRNVDELLVVVGGDGSGGERDGRFVDYG